MPFLDGFFSSIGQILPGYIEGRQQAIEDNWKDLDQYNKTQAGQLDNMFTEQTMDERLGMMADAANNSYMGMLNNAMMLDVNKAYQPGRLNFGAGFSAYSPYLAQYMYDAQARQADWARQYWANPAAAMRAMGMGGVAAPYMFSAVSGLGTNFNAPSIMQ